MKRILHCSAIVGLLLALNACSFDDRYFDATKTDNYVLSSNVIAASRVQEISIVSNQETIFGVFVKAALVADGTLAEAPTILYSHGNSDNIQEYWERLEDLDGLGYNMFIYDYQGFGKSTGSPSLEACRINAQDALNYLLSRGDVDHSKILYYGYSLGGVFSIQLAANVKSPWALVLEAAPASSAALAQNGVQVGLPSSFFFDESFDNLDDIHDVTAPVLLFHGTDDDEVPYDHNAEELAAAANNPKQFVKVQGADHENIPATLGESHYRDLIRQFVE